MRRYGRLSPLMTVARFTFLDEARQKSFIAMFVICVLFVLLMRGCYQGNYTVNGQALDPATVVTAVSKAMFHAIALAFMLIAALLSMRALRRDRAEGMQSAILSKPITRVRYIFGKIIGLWIVSSLFMLALHAIVFLIASISLKTLMPGYLLASLLCSLNLLFTVVMVLLLSLLMTDIVAFLCFLGIGIAGLIIDGIYAISRSPMTQTIMPQPGLQDQPGVSLGRIIYYLWPKISGMQRFASTFITGEPLQGFQSVYPFINILFYCLILTLLLLRRFKKEEIV